MPPGAGHRFHPVFAGLRGHSMRSPLRPSLPPVKAPPRSWCTGRGLALTPGGRSLRRLVAEINRQVLAGCSPGPVVVAADPPHPPLARLHCGPQPRQARVHVLGAPLDTDGHCARSGRRLLTARPADRRGHDSPPGSSSHTSATTTTVIPRPSQSWVTACRCVRPVSEVDGAHSSRPSAVTHSW